MPAGRAREKVEGPRAWGNPYGIDAEWCVAVVNQGFTRFAGSPLAIHSEPLRGSLKFGL